MLHMAFIYLHTSCHEIQVATNLVPCTLAPDITALILRYIHAYLYTKVMFSLWNFNSIAFGIIIYLLGRKEYMKSVIRGETIRVAGVVVVGVAVVVDITEIRAVAAIRRRRT